MANNNVGSADTLGVYVYATGQTAQEYDLYFQDASLTWRKYPDPTGSSYNNLVIPAGSVLSVLQRGPVSGAATFITPSLPY